jgi:hypothetical protein
MGYHARWRCSAKFLAKQMNVMAAIAQACRGSIKYPLGSTAKIEPLMRQSDLHFNQPNSALYSFQAR